MTTNIPVLQEITEANSIVAASLRAQFQRREILVLDLIASPGAGKTTLLERTIKALGDTIRLAVIEGDPTTSLDAERIAATGTPTVQINTGGGCHLEAGMILSALNQLDIDALDLVIIENVGNLVCPTGWDLGEDTKVVVASLPEGDDKPLKYPMAFAAAEVLLINKIDLEPYIPARANVLRANALTINPDLTVFELSCLTGEGFDPWLTWLNAHLNEKRTGRS